MSLRPGDVVEHFVIVSPLGEGGMGQVYLARDLHLQRSIALKIMHPESAGDVHSAGASGGAARLLREAQAAAGLDHPNVVTIFEVGEIKGEGEEVGRPFIAMELVKGKTLRAFVGDESVPMKERVRWLTDVARALAAAHRPGLVHRDIKPENVMVRDDGVVKVLDFGLAKRGGPSISTGSSSTEAQVLPSLTGQGVAIGTPYYMAPEQMRRETLDGRADQFAWGVVAYELLSGQPAWGRDVDALGLVSKILSEDPPPLHETYPAVPAHVGAVVMRALAKKRDARFETMEKVVDALANDTGAVGPSIPVSAPLVAAAAAQASLVPASGAPESVSGGAPAAPLPARRRRVIAALAGVGAVAVLAAIASRALLHPRGVESARDASPAAVAAESRMSSNAQATAAYRAGVQAMRDASLATAKEELDRAIELDTHFAVAHLRRALLPSDAIRAEQRQDLLDARNARDDLSERDRVLLDASQPSMALPPDTAEGWRREQAAVKQYPSDGELQFLLAALRDSSPEAAAAYDAAIAKDPGLAVAWAYKARYLTQTGDPAGAETAYGTCLGISASATTCLEGLAQQQAIEGHCQDLASTSRHLTSVAPRIPTAYSLLARGLLGTGQPIDAVRGALRQRWDRLPRERRRDELADQASLAVASGDFDGALRWDKEYEEEVASAPLEGTHFFPAYGQMLVNLEVGHTARALELASDYLRRRSAWEVYDYGPELSIFVYAVQASAGGLPKSSADALRLAWLKREGDRLARVGFASDPEELVRRWAAGYALFTTTPAEATAALQSWPDVPRSFRANQAYAAEATGRTYLLAGKVDEAIDVLTRLGSLCTDIDPMELIFTVWGALDLGEALEARGDTPGACLAYRKVLDRWGKAKPRSRTAMRASQRAVALRCGL